MFVFSMKKLLKVFSFVVIYLFSLSVFGWMAFHVSKGDKNFGFLNEPVKFMYSFPDLFTTSVEEVKTLPPTFIKTYEHFEAINRLESDLIVLSTYSDANNTRSIVLMNLKNDSVYYKWNVENDYEVTDRIINPILFSGKELVYSFQGKELRRIDSLSDIIWRQDSIEAHHAMTLDADSNIWLCSFEPVYHALGMYKLDGRSVFYKDNYITKLDPETGSILYHKSISSILEENDRSNYLLKSASVLDPLHCNDVEPAPKTTAYYKEGDVFISLRQPSLVIHFRPSTDEIVNMIKGPFISQHDVDFLNDSTLVLFNNNYYTNSSTASMQPPPDFGNLAVAGDFYSNIVCYHFAHDSFSFLGDSIFRANRIFTETEGLMEFIDDSTYFVEEQNSGLIWVLRNDEVVYKNVLASQHKGHHHLPNWIRIIDYDE